MAVRVTTDEVLEVIKDLPTTVGEDSDQTELTPFITVANMLINNTIVADYPDVFTAADLKEIERWLAAHFSAVGYKITASEAIGPVQETFQFKLGLNLQNTMWGQQAMLLDTTGSLAKANKKTGRKASINWLGSLDDDGYPQP